MLMMAILFSSRSLPLQRPYVSDHASISWSVIAGFQNELWESKDFDDTFRQVGEPGMCFREFKDENGTQDKFMDLKMHFESLRT
jgi:hypothetical protein